MTKPQLIEALRSYTHKDVLDLMMFNFNERELLTMLTYYQHGN